MSLLKPSIEQLIDERIISNATKNAEVGALASQVKKLQNLVDKVQTTLSTDMLPQITKVRKDFYTLNSTIAPSFNKMVELVAKLPEAPNNLTDVQNFNANMKRFMEVCKVDIDMFRQFQHPEAPIRFDTKIEYAEWEDSGVNWVGMRDIASKRAEGICWRINANGDSRLA